MPSRSTPRPFAPDGGVSLLQQGMQHSRTAFGLVDADTQALVWANPALEQWLREQPLPQGRAPFAGDDELQAARAAIRRVALWRATEAPALAPAPAAAGASPSAKP